MKPLLLPLLIASLVATATAAPNVIFILADDLGYSDLSCYGAQDVATPNIDQMASEGLHLTDFYVSPVCSPTRAALMTGCIPQRVGIGGVMFPRHSHGLNPEEITLPELLQEQGYATALIGKWHLGNQEVFMPLHHGFDYWYGTPASNSQFFDPKIQTYAEDCTWRDGYTLESILKMEQPKCPLVRNGEIIEVPADQSLFTQRYTKETIQFIQEHKDQPFFIYLAHNMPHIPLHASEEFVGTSERGLYGDTIQELDWSTGEILKTLQDLNLDENTLVVFTSDNGPNLKFGGHATPLRGAKGSTFEGGVRVPCILRWPGQIEAGKEIAAPATIMDFLPTLVTLAGGDVPSDRVIDGKDLWPLLSGEADESPHEAIYYLSGRSVDSIRVGDWKYQDTREAKDSKKDKDKPSGKALYNLREDIGEETNVMEAYPEVVERIRR